MLLPVGTITGLAARYQAALTASAFTGHVGFEPTTSTGQNDSKSPPEKQGMLGGEGGICYKCGMIQITFTGPIRLTDHIANCAARLGATPADIPGLWNIPGYPELTTAQMLSLPSPKE